jgi:hypothetical protein
MCASADACDVWPLSVCCMCYMSVLADQQQPLLSWLSHAFAQRDVCLWVHCQICNACGLWRCSCHLTAFTPCCGMLCCCMPQSAAPVRASIYARFCCGLLSCSVVCCMHVCMHVCMQTLPGTKSGRSRSFDVGCNMPASTKQLVFQAGVLGRLLRAVLSIGPTVVLLGFRDASAPIPEPWCP